MKIKIEVDQCSEYPKEWKISLSVDGITLNGNELKTLPDIVENHIREIWERTIKENPKS